MSLFANVPLRQACSGLAAIRLVGLLLIVLVVASDLCGAAPAELPQGAHVCLIGNTLADWMQHDGWLETLLNDRFPQHRLVIRNLGFSGDELQLRLRSAGFGSPDEHLNFNKADVIFAFFGYNESYADEAGLEAFRAELTRFIQHTREQKYNGRSAPELVLFSPITHENLEDRNLPDGRENNRRLALYTEAMRQTAAVLDCPFVDLLAPTARLYDEHPPLTTNGIHLNALGNRLLAEVIVKALFPRAGVGARDEATLERIRQAVLDKNHYWYNRYRTVDGYSIYGGRADLKFVDDQTNRVVMQRELEILDVMTANRDERIWAAVHGEELTINDDNTPDFIPVKTNKPGAGPGGAHVYLGGVEAVSQMTTAPGLEVSLFASEEQFPELINPVQMAFDTGGRLWVATWPTYPHWKPKEPMNDALLILTDENGDGRADRCQPFANDLHNPTGFEFWNGGVIVAMAPDLLWLKDTDGDDRADVRVRLLSGLDTADTHHTANSFTFDPLGALYFQEGTFHHTQVESPWVPTVRCANAGVFRFEPGTFKFDVYVTHPFANPHGHVFDRWGQDFVYDGTGSNPYHGALFSGHLDFPQKHVTPPQVYRQRTRPCPGVEILSSRHFPEDHQGNLLVGNVIGVQGILEYKLRDEGASFGAEEVTPVITSSDPNFRPSDLEIGPDGALWFTDWQNPVIGHMQHNLRDPSRDKIHGRVYRVTAKDRPLLTPPKIAGASIPDLLALLTQPEDRTRYRARIELSRHRSVDVVTAARDWLATLDKQDPEFAHHQLEGLWVFAQHNEVNEPLLERVLQSSDFRARAAATRVLCYWRDRLSQPLETLKRLARDEHPRVRLEAIRAASFFTDAPALEIPLLAAQLPSDQFLDFVRRETLRALEPYWKKALAAGGDLPGTDENSARLLLASVSTPELVAAGRGRAVCRALLERPGVTDDVRRDALGRLAALEQRSSATLLVATLRQLDAHPPQDQGVLFDLARLLLATPHTELQATRTELEPLALEGAVAVIRQIAFAALMTADGQAEPAWELGLRTPTLLVDVVRSMPFLQDAALRQQLVTHVEPILTTGSANLGIAEGPEEGVRGRYVRIELSGSRTLTLAEVEVYSDGTNVARGGKASQKNTANLAPASNAIDGNTSGAFSDHSQTHTRENTPDPWWEVDLKQTWPIDSIVIFNRTDGDLGQRLDGFRLLVLDDQHHVVFLREDMPAPAPRSLIELGEGSLADRLRRAAMGALASVPGREAVTFQALARFVLDGKDLPYALHALLAIPAQHWPAEQAAPLFQAVQGHLASLPVGDRTSAAALDALQVGETLAHLLPSDAARSARRALRELGVQMLRLATVPDRMLYDKELLAVEAGKPVEIFFENNDLMPHNMVLTRPGALTAVGMLAESMATQPGALDRHYVPPSDQILASSRLLAPRQTQRLKFNAPAEPGVYPYVCTYPGHWRRMYGALYVVASLDDYLADPQAYLAAHPLEIADEPLRSNRPRTEWKYADLESFVTDLGPGRSYNVGRQVFETANCVACHRLQGRGQEIGPDLAKLDAKIGPLDLLKSLLEPSAKIDDKFRSHIFQLASGKTLTGFVVKEEADAVHVVENPLVRAEATVIARSEVESRAPSPQSLMPLGMVDRLSREEILDLIAYLAARGNPEHPWFQMEHAGHGGH